VERCQGAGCSNFAQIATPAATTFNDTGLTASTSYSYRVRATDAAGNLSAFSSTATASTSAAPDTTPPSAPTNLTATAASSSQINLSWTASTDNVGVTGYKVERCSGVGCSNFAQIAAPTTTTFNDTGLTASTSYSYRVRATDAAGNLSTFSTTSSATTMASDTTAPTAPANLTASAASSTQINLSWTASTDNVGVTGYRVERCQGAGCSNFAQIATPTTTTFNDTGLTASTSYSYRVRATDAANNLSGYSTTATAMTQASSSIIVSISPKRAAVTTSQPQQFSATVTGTVTTTVNWSVDGTPGGTAAAGTISANGLYTPAAGTTPAVHVVGAASTVDANATASVNIAVTDLAGVLTHHNDNQRTGQNLKEYALTSATVSSATFGKLFSCSMDVADGAGFMYAQPLYVANLTMSDAKKHNVVFVATESDFVYAFDADSSSCQRFWKTGMLMAGETTVPPVDTGEPNDLIPEIGITSTPVIDTTANPMTIYVCAKSKDSVGGYHHRLHALNLITGAEKAASPVEITATNFNSLFHMQRPALLFNNGTLYIAFGSHGDNNVYQGWLMGYDPATLAQKFVFFTSDPTNSGPAGSGNQGAIWQSGGGPAADSSGNVYVETANGTFDADSGGINYGDSALKLSATGSVLDYFTPSNQATLSNNDVDLGSAGPIVLPDTLRTVAPLHLLLVTGKPGILYLLDRGNLGKFHSGGDQAVQEVIVSPNTTQIIGGLFPQPAYWNGNIYTAAVADSLKQYPISGSAIPPISQLPQSQSSHSFDLRGATPAVSANGTSNGIVWLLDIGAYPNGPAVLYAFDASNVTTPLYNSPASGSGAAGNAVKFTVPTVANGKVYVGGQGVLTVFGLLPN
jgi:chitodextrinase